MQYFCHFHLIYADICKNITLNTDFLGSNSKSKLEAGFTKLQP